MEESVTYQKIIRKGMAEGIAKGKTAEARRILLMLGRDSAAVQAALEAVTDLNRLEELNRSLQQVASWQELLGEPAPRGRASRKRRPS